MCLCVFWNVDYTSSASSTFPSSLSPLSSATSISPPTFHQTQSASTLMPMPMPTQSDASPLSQMFIFDNSFGTNVLASDTQMMSTLKNQPMIAEQDMLRTKQPVPNRLNTGSNNNNHHNICRKRTSAGRKSAKSQKAVSAAHVNDVMTLDNNNQCCDNNNTNAAYLSMYEMQDVGMVQQQCYGAIDSATTAGLTSSDRTHQAKQTNEPDILSLVLSYKKCALLRDPEIIRLFSSIR